MHVEPKITVSNTRKMEMKNKIKIAAVDKKQEPAIPIKRPKKTQDKKLKNGNNRTEKYIKKKRFKRVELKKRSSWIRTNNKMHQKQTRYPFWLCSEKVLRLESEKNQKSHH